jgi:hypothetical protein
MKSVWIANVLLSALFAFPGQSAAQEGTTAEPPSSREVKKPPTARDFTLGLAFQGPTRLTGSATVIWGKPRMLVAFAPGKLAQVRVGAGGAQIGVGLVAGVFEESPWKPSGLAVTLKAIAIRTWRDPDPLQNGRSYAGLESDVVLLGIRGSIGYARKVGGPGGSDGQFVWSVGLGL